MYYKVAILLLLIICFFSSCEYEFKDENYIKLENQNLSDYYLKINVPQDANGNYLINYDYITYETNIPRDSITRIYIRIGYYSGNSFESWVSFNEYSESTLYVGEASSYYNRMMVTVSTVERSDNLLATMYNNKISYTFEFPIVVQKKAITLNLHYENQPDGSLKVLWDNVDPFYGTLDYYEIRDPNWNIMRKTTNDEFLIIGKDEYLRYYNITVCAYFKEEYPRPLCEELYVY